MPKPFIWAFLAALVAVSAYIRVHGGDGYHFNNDEAMHFNVATGSTLADVLRFSFYEVHPPAFYFLLHYWLMISSSPAFARGFSLLFGILTIPLYFRIGKLLGGELTGLCAAMLVAFSHGCIIQSYLVRQYAVFLFFLSCGFYFYMLWRKDRKTSSLLAYSGFISIASLIHFSAVMAVFCMALHGLTELYPWKSAWKKTFWWVLANLPPALIVLASYLYLEPTLHCVKAYVDASITGPDFHPSHSLWKYLLAYPLDVAVYICTNPVEALILLFLTPILGWKNAALRPYLVLAGVALGLGTVLYDANIYNIISARHYIWTFPFFIAVAAGAASEISVRCCKAIPEKLSPQRGPVAAVLLFAAGCAMYDPTARYADIFEYQVPEAQWQSLLRYTDTLGPNTLLVANRDDAILLQNNYPYLKDATCSGPSAAALVPFNHTHILISPSYRRFYDEDFLISLFKKAEESGMLDGVDTLAFYQTRWARVLEPDLSLCPIPGKKVMVFAQTNPSHGEHAEGNSRAYAKLFIVPKADFIAQVLSPAGQAHSCIIGTHDPHYGSLISPQK